MKTASIAAASLFGLLLSLASAAEPPETTGTLNGRLTDSHSAPLEQATITLRNLTTGTTQQGITGKNGSYRFTNLGPGEYRLEADVPQLGRGAVEGILVSAGHATRVQAALIMELPPLPTAPEDTFHELDPVAAAVSTLISSADLASLPTPTRNWQEFVSSTPAANPSSQTSTRTGQIGDQTGGQSDAGSAEAAPAEDLSFDIETMTASSIDGIHTTQAFHTESTHRGDQSGGPGQSAIVEFQARSSNAPADQAPSASSSINFVTAHGRNGLHGQFVYTNRQSAWGAKNPFTQWVQETTPTNGIDTAQFTAEPYSAPRSRQSFGFGLGSQIKSQKLYWFAALDGLLRNDPAVATVRHPDRFFARPSNEELTALSVRLDLPGPALLEQSAAAYSTGLEQLAGLLGPVPRSAHQWQGFARLDWQATDRNHFVVQGNVTSLDAPAGAIIRSSATYGNRSFGNSQASEDLLLGRWEAFLTPNLLSSAAVLIKRHDQSDSPQTSSAFEAPLLINDFGQLPEIVTDSSNGFILGTPATLGHGSRPDERAFVLQDTLNWVPGNHLIKAGGSFTHISDFVDTLVNQAGTYSYADVLNFISDYSAFSKYGINGVDNPFTNQHNCDARGRIYQLGNGTFGGLGYLPCYAWYTQRIGPSNWHLSTNDLAAFATEQWQPAHNLTLSAGIRLEAEQLPAPIAAIANPELPQTQKFPAATLDWGPRIGLAWEPWKSTVLRLGAGLYFGRIDNSTILTALTQTGSPASDLNLFFKPTDQGAPPFPYVFSTLPQTIVKPGAFSFAPRFRPQQVEQAVFNIEHELPSHWIVSVSALASLGRRLPIALDANLAPPIDDKGDPKKLTYTVIDASGKGPLPAGSHVTVPFYTARTNLNYQQLATFESRANSTYQAAMVKLTHYGGHGLSLRAHYLYAHATDWNPNESAQVAVNDVLDPGDFRLEYGTSNLDIRHSAAAIVHYEAPWQLHRLPVILAQLVNGWSIAAVAQFRSGLPFTMRTSGYIPAYYTDDHTLIEGLGPGINGSAGDNRLYGIGRNTYRYPMTYTGDARIGKRFDLHNHRELELLAESFNLLNHQNVTLIETTGYIIHRGTTSQGPPTLNFLTGLDKNGQPTVTPEFGKPLDVNATNFYRQREFQLGLRARF